MIKKIFKVIVLLGLVGWIALAAVFGCIFSTLNHKHTNTEISESGVETILTENVLTENILTENEES